MVGDDLPIEEKQVFGKLKTEHYQVICKLCDSLSDFAMFSNYFTINSLCYVLLYNKFSWFYPYGFTLMVLGRVKLVTLIASLLGVDHYNGFMKNCTSPLVLSIFLLVHLYRMCRLSVGTHDFFSVQDSSILISSFTLTTIDDFFLTNVYFDEDFSLIDTSLSSTLIGGDFFPTNVYSDEDSFLTHEEYKFITGRVNEGDKLPILNFLSHGEGAKVEWYSSAVRNSTSALALEASNSIVLIFPTVVPNSPSATFRAFSNCVIAALLEAEVAFTSVTRALATPKYLDNASEDFCVVAITTFSLVTLVSDAEALALEAAASDFEESRHLALSASRSSTVKYATFVFAALEGSGRGIGEFPEVGIITLREAQAGPFLATVSFSAAFSFPTIYRYMKSDDMWMACGPTSRDDRQQ
ncbi:hypothetical protein CR513_24779, partial [Mucuna pruriens]